VSYFLIKNRYEKEKKKREIATKQREKISREIETE